MNNRINLKQTKYILPLGVYAFALFVGYQVIRLFTIEVEDKGDKSLVTTDYLNGDLPTATSRTSPTTLTVCGRRRSTGPIIPMRSLPPWSDRPRRLKTASGLRSCRTVSVMPADRARRWAVTTSSFL